MKYRIVINCFLFFNLVALQHRLKSLRLTKARYLSNSYKRGPINTDVIGCHRGSFLFLSFFISFSFSFSFCFSNRKFARNKERERKTKKKNE